jgi:hypothetical protein
MDSELSSRPVVSKRIVRKTERASSSLNLQTPHDLFLRPVFDSGEGQTRMGERGKSNEINGAGGGNLDSAVT